MMAVGGTQTYLLEILLDFGTCSKPESLTSCMASFFCYPRFDACTALCGFEKPSMVLSGNCPRSE
jgi:hypothetical protein